MDHQSRTFRRFFESAVERNESSPYLIFTGDDSTHSYGRVNEQTDRAARVWYDLGVRRGDRVAIMLDNSPEFMFAWLGLAKIGAILVAVNTGFRSFEVSYLVRDSEAKFALVGTNHLPMFALAEAEAPTLEKTFTIGEDPTHEDFLSYMANADADVPQVDVREDDILSLIYTSGTTGNPKGVMQTQNNFVMTGQAYPTWMRMEKGHRIYACLPLFHINSQAYSTMGAIGAEGAIVLSPRFSARRFWPEVRRHQVNVFNFIGAMTVILSKKEHEDNDLDNVVHTAYGVPAIPLDVAIDIEKRFGLRVVSGFGMSETTFGLLEPFDGERRPGTMGIPRHHPDPTVPRTEAAIIDEDGNIVGDGVPGELILRNAAMMKGYFNDPVRTAEVLSDDGWLRTGDSAWRDTDGYYYFLDRKKDIVRRRGENVSSLEVEKVVDEHPGVMESAIVGIASELTDEDIVAFVVPRGDAAITAEDVIEWCEERLAAFKVPRFVAFVEALPKTPTSKIEKHRLRQDKPSADWFDRERQPTA